MLKVIEAVLASSDVNKVIADNISFAPSFSPDGNDLIFYSLASNLVLNDTNNANDIFLKDLTSQVVFRQSVDVSGNQANNSSYLPDFAPDGNSIVYYSGASNLVINDTNNSNDVFLRDITTGDVTRLSTDVGGTQGNGNSSHPVFSPDGNNVAFYSFASNLVGSDTNSTRDVFIKDLTTDAVTLISRDSNGVQGNGGSDTPVFSPDGNSVAFISIATNLVNGDTNGLADIFVKNLTDDSITRINTDENGVQANSFSSGPVFSPDGTKVAFQSAANNLISGDTNNAFDLFLKDLTTGAITRISTDSSGNEVNGGSNSAVFSADGNTVFFQSSASNLVANDTNNANDIFAKDLLTGEVTRVSVHPDGTEANGHSTTPALSPDGTQIAFQSAANNFVSNDTNNRNDVFVLTLLEATEGTENNDNIVGTDEIDWILGLGGNDNLSGRGENDTLVGGDGDDVLRGENDNDVLEGEAGWDWLEGGSGDDTLEGGLQGDGLTGGDGNDVFLFRDLLHSKNGARDSIYDFVQGEDLINVFDIGISGIQSGAADGSILGYSHSNGDTIIYDESATFNLRLVGEFTLTVDDLIADPSQGGPGDTMGGGTSTSPSAGDDSITGTSGDDSISALDGNDTVDALEGNDYINGGNGNDIVTLADGNDTLVAGAGDDTATGGAGNDNLYGNSGNDSLSADAGFDWLDASSGDDTLSGGSQGDGLTGGSGADIFLYTALTDSRDVPGGRDTIYDFAQGEDLLDFSALAVGIVAIGGAAFNGNLTPEARQFIDGTRTVLSLDIDGDASEDMAVAFNTTSITFLDTDFI